MSFADECYQRLQAAQRVVSRHELEEIEAEQERQSKRIRLNRKLPKVY